MKNIITLTIAALLIAAPLAKGMDSKTKDLGRKLCDAIAQQDDAKIKALLRKGAPVNYQDPKTKITPLMITIQKGMHTTTKLLLDSGADITLRQAPPCQYNALLFASFIGNKESVKILLDHCHNDPHQLNSVTLDNEGNTPLMCAIEKKHEGVVEELLLRGADYTLKQRSPVACNALLLAIIGKNEKIIRLLLEHIKDNNAELNSTISNTHTTPLMLATTSGDTNIVKILLENPYPIDLNLTDINGLTALMWAAKNGRAECIKLLLAKHPNADITAPDGQTALTLALRFICVFRETGETCSRLILPHCDIKAQLANPKTNSLITQLGGKDLTELLLKSIEETASQAGPPCDTPTTQESAAAPDDVATVEMQSDDTETSECAAAPETAYQCLSCKQKTEDLLYCLRCRENYCDSCIETHKRPNKCARVCWTCKQILNDYKKCSGCLQAYYCSRECQKKDWKKGHRQWCLENRSEEDTTE